MVCPGQLLGRSAAEPVYILFLDSVCVLERDYSASMRRLSSDVCQTFQVHYNARQCQAVLILYQITIQHNINGGKSDAHGALKFAIDLQCSLHCSVLLPVRSLDSYFAFSCSCAIVTPRTPFIPKWSLSVLLDHDSIDINSRLVGSRRELIEQHTLLNEVKSGAFDTTHLVKMSSSMRGEPHTVADAQIEEVGDG